MNYDFSKWTKKMSKSVNKFKKTIVGNAKENGKESGKDM